MAIRPLLVDKRSPFVGEHCALCKEPFAPGEEVILCPEDASRHHVYCWEANGNHCAAFGCRGTGTPIKRTPLPEQDGEQDGVETEAERNPSSSVKTLPASSFSCAQSCLIIAIAVSIVLIAVSCFGLWAILDYVVVEILGWQYRQPLSGLGMNLALMIGPLMQYIALA
jgi:hypothetical protein